MRRAARGRAGCGDQLRGARAVPTGRRPCPGGAARRSRRTRSSGAASAANRIISTAPMPKFGAMTHADSRGGGEPGRAAVASRSSSKPVVPTTAWMPCADADARGCPSPTSGWVKSTATWAPAVDQRRQRVADVDRGDQLQVVGGLDGPADLGAHAAPGADDGRPGASVTRSAVSQVRRSRRSGDRGARSRGRSSNGPMTASVGRAAEQLGGDRRAPRRGSPRRSGAGLVDGQQLAVDELALADPAHPRRRCPRGRGRVEPAQLALAAARAPRR